MAEDTNQPEAGTDPTAAVHANDPATAAPDASLTNPPAAPVAPPAVDPAIAAMAAVINTAPPAAAPAVRPVDAPPPASVVFTYADGSQVVGVPDFEKHGETGFPKLSPVETEAAAKRDDALIAKQQQFANDEAAQLAARQQAAAVALENMVTARDVVQTKG